MATTAKIITPPLSERATAAIVQSFETKGGSFLSNVIRGYEANENPEYVEVLERVEGVLKEQSNAYHVAMLKKRAGIK